MTWGTAGAAAALLPTQVPAWEACHLAAVVELLPAARPAAAAAAGSQAFGALLLQACPLVLVVAWAAWAAWEEAPAPDHSQQPG